MRRIVNLLDLSHDLFGSICAYLPEESILQLRMASKTSEEMVCTLLRTKETVIRKFNFAGMDDQRTCITLYITRQRDYFMWKLAISYSLIKMDNSLSSRARVLPIHNVQLYLEANDLQKIFEFLKPLTLHANICELNTYSNINPARIYNLSRFLDGKSIPSVGAYHELSTSADFLSFLDLLHRIKIGHIHAYMSLAKDTVDYMFQMASMVKSISISQFRQSSSLHYFLDAAFLQNMFTGKCEKLVICNNLFPISQEDADKLVNILHHCGKKVVYSICCHGPEIDTQIGECKVDLVYCLFFRNPTSGNMTIRHIEKETN